jgi:hypothetical protein
MDAAENWSKNRRANEDFPERKQKHLRPCSARQNSDLFRAKSVVNWGGYAIIIQADSARRNPVDGGLFLPRYLSGGARGFDLKSDGVGAENC